MPQGSIRKLYLIMDRGSGYSSQEFQEYFTGLFPYLDISADIYLIAEDMARDFPRVRETIKQIALFLKRYSFYRINIHPVHPLPFEDLLKGIYNDFFQIINPFNREGYLHQSVSRIMILPILVAEEKDDVGLLNRCLDFLRDRLMVPSIYIPGDASTGGIKGIVRSDKERIYLELTGGDKLERLMNTLGVHSVFDELMTWANAPVKGSLRGCPSIVLREKDGDIYNCFKTAPSKQSVSNLYSMNSLSDLSMTFETHENNRNDCLNCAVESLSLMKDTLRINDREKEAFSISFHLGMELVKQEDYDGALEHFDRVLTGHTDFEDMGTILLSKALCHLRRNENEKAMVTLEEAERHIPSSAMIYYYKGLCEFGLRDYIEAIDRLQDALKMGYDRLPLGDVYFYAGLSHINIEEYGDGLAMMNRAEEFFTEKSPLYYYMGLCYLGMRDLDAALDYLKKALVCKPQKENLSSIHFYLGLCYKEMGRHEDALLDLKRARDTEEGRKDIHNLMGYCYFKLKEYDDAIQSFMRTVEIDPNSAIDYANIGVNLREKGEIEKAIPMFKKALGLDPSIGFARKHLAEIAEEPS
ncbi:MAG: tetratricopeptide repeat protein [Desulfobacterales bacterium]|nr:tetratricopeptide repeat protein [Desulfobacterales bacterium]